MKAAVITIFLSIVAGIITFYITDGTIWMFVRESFDFLFIPVAIPVWLLLILTVLIGGGAFWLGSKVPLRPQASGVITVRAELPVDSSVAQPSGTSSTLNTESRRQYMISKLIMGAVAGGLHVSKSDVVRELANSYDNKDVDEVVAELLHIGALEYQGSYLKKTKNGDHILMDKFQGAA